MFLFCARSVNQDKSCLDKSPQVIDPKSPKVQHSLSSGRESGARQYRCWNQHIPLHQDQIQKSADSQGAGTRQSAFDATFGVKFFNVPNLTEGVYIELVDFTGREWHESAVRLNQMRPKHSSSLGWIQIIGLPALKA